MATFNQIMGSFEQQIMLFGQRISAFFSFIASRIKNFKTISLPEQVSFGLIGIGLVFIITSIILFLL